MGSTSSRSRLSSGSVVVVSVVVVVVVAVVPAAAVCCHLLMIGVRWLLFRGYIIFLMMMLLQSPLVSVMVMATVSTRLTLAVQKLFHQTRLWR